MFCGIPDVLYTSTSRTLYRMNYERCELCDAGFANAAMRPHLPFIGEEYLINTARRLVKYLESGKTEVVDHNSSNECGQIYACYIRKQKYKGMYTQYLYRNVALLLFL